MADTRFDTLTKRFAVRSTRRSTLLLLAGGLLGALLPGRRVSAQQEDNDNDGLFDDDEVNVYGTRPDLSDTDNDGISDGQEICNRDRQDPNCQQDQVHVNPLVNEGAAAPPPPPDPAGAPPAATCIALGGACFNIDLPCCGNDPATFGYNNIICCPTNLTGSSACTDIAGVFLCPDPAAVPATGCPEGWTNCGGVCTNLAIDNGNCGACGHSCGIDSNCTNSSCVVSCLPGLASCNGACVNVQSDIYNCGACGHHCDLQEPDATVTCEAATCHYRY